MPEICRFLGIIITMYFNEHNPPHFHARYGDQSAEIAIETLSIIAGKLPPRGFGVGHGMGGTTPPGVDGRLGTGPSSSRTQTYCPTGVTTMFLIDVVAVTPMDGHRLELSFKDGLKAVVDVDRIIQRFDGVFAPLKDPDYFRLVRVDPEIGTIVWPNGADLCPDVLYSYASGKPIIVNGERVLN